MNKLIISLLLSGIFLCIQCADSTSTFDSKIKSSLDKSFDELNQKAEELREAASEADTVKLKQAFQNCRNAYKKVEWFTEYYMPGASKLLNGAPLPEIEIEETKTFAPAGLQVIEEHIYADKIEQDELVREIGLFSAKLKLALNTVHDLEFTEAQVINACKIQVFRIVTLGISGFDTPLSLTGVSELQHSLEGIKEVLAFVPEANALTPLIGKAQTYVKSAPSFNDFDRLAFMREYAAPITRALAELQKQPGFTANQNLALNAGAGTLFDRNVFNADFFADNAESFFTDEKMHLGKKLFSDPVLSGNNKTCRSCHNPELAFTDGLPKSSAIIPGTFVKRNAPTLLYSSLQQAQFYDMRSPSLEDQAGDVLANKDEMHASVELAAGRIARDSELLKQFKSAFPAMTELKPRYVAIAIASYLRSLTPFSSDFDLYMRGDDTRLTAKQAKGFNLFMGKAKCGTCHFVPVFNGTAAPSFTTTEAEVLGIPDKPGSLVLDSDPGRFAHNKLNELRFSFKTPTLRNVAVTAPYMHNGAFKSLEEVLEFYNDGGGQGLGITIDNQTLPSEPLLLDEDEQDAIIAFLKALTDKEYKLPGT